MCYNTYFNRSHSPPASNATSSLILRKCPFLGTRGRTEAARQDYSSPSPTKLSTSTHIFLPDIRRVLHAIKANPSQGFRIAPVSPQPFSPPTPTHTSWEHLLSLPTSPTYTFNFLLCVGMLASAMGTLKHNIPNPSLCPPSFYTLPHFFSFLSLKSDSPKMCLHCTTVIAPWFTFTRFKMVSHVFTSLGPLHQALLSLC